MKGRRPIATSTTSASSVSAWPPAAGSIVALTPAPVLSTFVTFVGEAEAKTLLLQHPLKLPGDLAVHARQDAVEEFDDGDLGAQARPDRAEFEPDHAGADDQQLPGPSSAPARRSRRRRLFVDLNPGSGATSEPVAMAIPFVSSDALAGGVGDLDLARRRMRPSPMKGSTLFFLNRKATPLTLAATVSSLCFIMRGRSSSAVPTTTPSGTEAMGRLLEHLRGVEQRLGRDAADVEAGAAEGLALLDHRDLQAELGGADGADVAPGASADDDDIVGHAVWSRDQCGCYPNCFKPGDVSRPSGGVSPPDAPRRGAASWP